MGMLRKLGQAALRRRRNPATQLSQINAHLARGWSHDAFDRLSALATEGYAEAQYRLAQVYERAEGVVQNIADAVHWYRLAAEQGHRDSQSRLGLIYFIEPPPAASVAEEDGSARVGNGRTARAEPSVGSLLGRSFTRGTAVKQDFPEAAKWNRLAGEGGDAEAQARLGHQFALGLGVEQSYERAEHLFTTAAESSNVSGQAGLGILYAGGYGGASQVQRALPWLMRASDGGSLPATYWLGVLHLRDGNGIVADAQKAMEWLQQAASQGLLDAMYQLGLTYWRGDAVKRDEFSAETWLRRAASRGHVAAMRSLGQFLLERPDDTSIDAADWLQRAAEYGDRRAAAHLADLYLHGRHVPSDAGRAAHWLQAADSAGRLDAYNELASHYIEHAKTPKDVDAAAIWLERAARRGNVAAQYNLGSLHRLGRIERPDVAQAVDWYRSAADRGSAQAAFYLGLLYAEEGSPIQDFCESAHWFRRAMERGHGLALCNVSLQTIQGRGIRKNVARAVRMLDQAATAGNVDAAELLVDLYSNGEVLIPVAGRAAHYLALAVRLGSSDAALMMVEARLRDVDWPYDRASIRSVLERAARAGDIEASFGLGRLLAQWPGEAPDYAAAIGWFKMASEAGHSGAQVWMGDCCLRGLYGAQDQSAAEQWYRKAAAQMHPAALSRLAQLLDAQGIDDPLKEAELFGLWLAAASAGEALAQRMVATCYVHGKGCPAEPASAVRWFTAAAHQGDRESQHHLDSRQGDDRQLNVVAENVDLA